MYLNIGGGNFKKDNWLNLDFPFDSYKHKRNFELIDIPHNLMELKPIPVRTNSIDGIYTEHTIEHISFKATQCMIQEAHRIMKKGTFFRIACPDIDLLYTHYFQQNEKFYNKLRTKKEKRSILNLFLNSFTVCNDEAAAEEVLKNLPKIKALKYIQTHLSIKEARPNAHIEWWNEDRISKELIKAGFINIERSMPGQSKCKAFRDKGLDKTGQAWSIYMECQK